MKVRLAFRRASKGPPLVNCSERAVARSVGSLLAGNQRKPATKVGVRQGDDTRSTESRRRTDGEPRTFLGGAASFERDLRQAILMEVAAVRVSPRGVSEGRLTSPWYPMLIVTKLAPDALLRVRGHLQVFVTTTSTEVTGHPPCTTLGRAGRGGSCGGSVLSEPTSFTRCPNAAGSAVWNRDVFP